MALDPMLSDQLTLDSLHGAREGMKLAGVIDRNLVQGLGVVNTTLIQQHGSTADDAATMAALRTSIHIPEKSA